MSCFAPREEEGFVQKTVLPYYQPHPAPQSLAKRHPYLPEQSARLHRHELTLAFGETHFLARVLTQLAEIEDEHRLSEILDNLSEILPDQFEKARVSVMMDTPLLRKLMLITQSHEVNSVRWASTIRKVREAIRFCSGICTIQTGRNLFDNSEVAARLREILETQPDFSSCCSTPSFLDDWKNEIYRGEDFCWKKAGECTIFPWELPLLTAQRQVAHCAKILSLTNSGIQILVTNAVPIAIVGFLIQNLPEKALQDRIIFDTVTDMLITLATVTQYNPSCILVAEPLVLQKISQFLRLYLGQQEMQHLFVGNNEPEDSTLNTKLPTVEFHNLIPCDMPEQIEENNTNDVDAAKDNATNHDDPHTTPRNITSGPNGRDAHGNLKSPGAPMKRKRNEDGEKNSRPTGKPGSATTVEENKKTDPLKTRNKRKFTFSDSESVGSTLSIQLKVFLAALRVMSNVGSVRLEKPKDDHNPPVNVNLSCIDLCNKLARHTLLKEMAISVLCSGSPEMEVKKRIDPLVISHVLLDPENRKGSRNMDYELYEGGNGGNANHNRFTERPYAVDNNTVLGGNAALSVSLTVSSGDGLGQPPFMGQQLPQPPTTTVAPTGGLVAGQAAIAKPTQIYSMALRTARAASEYPEFRKKFVSEILHDVDLLENVFAINALPYVFQLVQDKPKDALKALHTILVRMKRREKAIRDAHNKTEEDEVVSSQGAPISPTTMDYSPSPTSVGGSPVPGALLSTISGAAAHVAQIDQNPTGAPVNPGQSPASTAVAAAPAATALGAIAAEGIDASAKKLEPEDISSVLNVNPVFVCDAIATSTRYSLKSVVRLAYTQCGGLEQTLDKFIYGKNVDSEVRKYAKAILDEIKDGVESIEAEKLI